MLDKLFFSLVIVVIGYTVCFYGFKLKNILSVFIWFLLGFTVSNEIFKNVFLQVDMLHALSTMFGLICSLFSYKLNLLNVFIIVTWIVGNVLYTKLQFEPNVNLLLSILAGAIIGLISVKYIKIILIIATSIIGSGIMVNALSLLPISIDQILVLAIQIFIAILGILYQFKTCKTRNDIKEVAE